ncbi:MAG: Thiol-disulfide oxidoreductase ResA [Elusimicrobia bacterium]|nr:Thiol-disulfide oxidoreductase ResA [Elusimicrobiota bacterium]
MNKKIFLCALALNFGGFSQAAFINDPAPAFALKSMDGKEVKLSDFDGMVVLVNFWASWCPPCKKEFPELNELANEYKGQGAKVVGINLDKSVSRVEKFLEKVGSKPDAMIILLDPDSKVVANYVARSMPSSFIVDKNGVIRYVHFGFNDKDPLKWRSEINGLLAEERKK